MSLPAADDLFRTTRHAREMRERGTAARELAGREMPGRRPEQGESAPQHAVEPSPAAVAPPVAAPAAEPVTAPAVAPVAESAAEKAARRSSGRVRHDEKMTVYVTADELLDIEHARLSLRRHQGLAVDRGRLVREAIAIVLEDLDDHGDDSVLVQRLIGR